VDQTQLGTWTDLLARAGFRPGAVLGSGMEGAVIDLGDDLVAKIWKRRTAKELDTLRAFYDAVAGAQPAVRTPRILQVLTQGGQLATVEPRLAGRPLWNPDGESPALTDADVASVVAVLEALAEIDPTPGMAALPVLESEGPFVAGSFARSLADLVERRVARFRGPLLARLPDLDSVTKAVLAGLAGLEPGREGLVHGDLVPANILVDGRSRPLAVIDFGFLTTVGDPAFDAAVASSIYDMYGPRARETEEALDTAITERFHHEAGRLALYRAAYALATSNCYSASGSDGHFDWCARLLERPDIRAAF